MSDYIVWVDVAATGLDPLRANILEIAVVVTTRRYLRVVEHYHRILPEPYPNWEADLDPVVAEMHTANRLIADVRAREAVDSAAERLRIMEVAGERVGRYPKSPVGGSSVHFDRAMVSESWPFVFEGLSHRNRDVSTLRYTIRDLCEAEGVDPQLVLWEQEGKHRALSDVLDHIAEYRHYLRVMAEGVRAFAAEHSR